MIIRFSGPDFHRNSGVAKNTLTHNSIIIMAMNVHCFQCKANFDTHSHYPKLHNIVLIALGHASTLSFRLHYSERIQSFVCRKERA